MRRRNPRIKDPTQRGGGFAKMLARPDPVTMIKLTDPGMMCTWNDDRANFMIIGSAVGKTFVLSLSNGRAYGYGALTYSLDVEMRHSAPVIPTTLSRVCNSANLHSREDGRAK